MSDQMADREIDFDRMVRTALAHLRLAKLVAPSKWHHEMVDNAAFNIHRCLPEHVPVITQREAEEVKHIGN